MRIYFHKFYIVDICFRNWCTLQNRKKSDTCFDVIYLLFKIDKTPITNASDAVSRILLVIALSSDTIHTD